MFIKDVYNFVRLLAGEEKGCKVAFRTEFNAVQGVRHKGSLQMSIG